MELDEKTIARLISEAVDSLGIEGAYDLSTRYLDMEAIAREKALTSEEIAKNFALAGLCAGIRYTLENLDIAEDNSKE